MSDFSFLITAYPPQTNESTERFNKMLADILSMHIDTEQKNWDAILPFMTFAYNSAKQDTTAFIHSFLYMARLFLLYYFNHFQIK